MGRQSSRIYFNGQDHKEIYFNGHYHKAMYIGSQLVWEKLNSEYEQDKYINVADYSIYDGETYFVCYLYDDSNNQDTRMGVYIGKFNKDKICVDLLYKIEEIEGYNRYLIHACKDGIVLIKYDYKFSESNSKNIPIIQIAGLDIRKDTEFKKVGKGSFTEDTTIFVPPFMQNDVYNPFQFMVFGTDYYIKQNIVYDDSNYGYTNLIKYSYDNQIIKETAADDTIISISPYQVPEYRNIFSINDKYCMLQSKKNGRSSAYRNMIGMSYDKGLENKKKYTMESSDYAYQDLAQVSSGKEAGVKRRFAVCGESMYAIGRMNAGRPDVKFRDTIFSFSADKLSFGIKMPVENAVLDTIDAIGDRLIAYSPINNTRCFYLIENGQIKNTYANNVTADAYAYDGKQIYLLIGAYMYLFDNELSYQKAELAKIRLI